MSRYGRVIGLVLIIGGLIVCLGGSLVSFTATRGVEEGATGGFVLGAVISAFVALPLVGGGLFLIIQGRAEKSHQADRVRQRKILDMVKTRGQIDISDLVFELDANREQVREYIYQLVGLGLFTGYVNWDKGVLYSREISKLKGNTCPNCGGEQAFVGKGVIACQHCGAEVFL